jgi:NAD(P)H-hydrate epimerase
MRSVTSSAAALAADRAAETEFGYPAWLLMEEAGIRLQESVASRWPTGPLVYLAGSGNNGGDALVMARQAFLRGRRDVTVIQVFSPSSESCRLQNGWAAKTGVPLLNWPSSEAEHALNAAVVWIDGLWGTGLSAPLRPDRSEALVQLETFRSRTNVPVAAIDVPSGLWEGRAPTDPVLKASLTLAPGWVKDFCFYPASRELCGEIEAVTMAFPREALSSAVQFEESDLARLLPRVGAADHKGRRGHVAVFGGASGMTGAAVLAARSSAAAGAGLVSLGCDAEVIPLIAPQVPAFQVRPAAELSTRLARLNALVVGPGWGQGADRPMLLETLWNTGLPMAIDADGLAAWNALKLPVRDVPVVLTPHPGEFARLSATGSRSDDTVRAASTLARERGVTVVLKGAVTWVLASDGRRAVWDGANPALGTGGSGDCLAGVVGALLARGLPGFEAATAAVALHGSAGKMLASEFGWFTADRLPDAVARTAAACMAGPVGL